MAGINRYTNPLGQSLEQYVPIPFQEMAAAGQAIQQRGDLAEQQQMQQEIGLASMEALAPAYAKFRDTFVNDYKTKAGALLEKYKNPSDPEFIRESRKLNLTFAADPRLQTIKQGNEFIKGQQKIAQELSAKGIKAIDPNRNFTGVDANGRLIVPTGNIRGTNFDEDLTKSFLQIRDNMVDNGKGWKTNQPNIDNLAKNMLANIDSNPITRDAQDYYMQQGMNPQQARQATEGLIRQAYTDNLRTDRDYAYDNLQINREQLALAKRRQAMDEMEFSAKANAKKMQGTGLLPEQSPINPEDLNRDLLNGVDKVLSNLNSVGGLSKKGVTVADTPENRKKYAGKFSPFKSPDQTIEHGIVIKGTNQLRINDNNYNVDDLQVLKTAREQLGQAATNGKGGFLKDKTVLEKYKQFLKNDNASYTFWNTTNGDQLKMLDNLYVGANGEKLGNATLIKDGKTTQIASGDGGLKGLKGFSFSGVSAAPMKGFPNGAIKVNAVDEDNNPVQILKPLDNQTARLFQVTNTGYKALTSGKSNSEIAKDSSMHMMIDNQILVPQKNPGGGISLYRLNSDGKVSKTPAVLQEADGSVIDAFEAYEEAERGNFNNYLTGFTNKG